MSTPYNTTIKLYTGVPLVKGGTEVLYLSQGAAEGALAGYVKATYDDYYFARDNRRAVQVDATFAECEGVNYISFANKSHGGKIFFGFVDEIVYINDNCTEIRYTIDPFPTYLGDTTERENFFIVRNTPAADIRGANVQDDYLPSSAKIEYHHLQSFVTKCSRAWVIFASRSHDSAINEISVEGVGSGIFYGPLSATNISDIQTNGGVIVGVYLFPEAFTGGEAIQNFGLIGGNPLAHLSSYTWNKIRSGVYTEIALATSQQLKTYNLEQFSDPTAVYFQLVGVLLPQPAIFIYPKNYNGIEDNTSEGVYIQAPAMPFSSAPGYGGAQLNSDIFNLLGATIGGALSGAMMGGGAPGAIVGAVGGAAGGIGNMAKHAYMSKFNSPQILSGNMPVVTKDKFIRVGVYATHPTTEDLERIDKYFSYYGYAQNRPVDPSTLSGHLNLANGAYLQTGSEFLIGSEADDELNARIMAGIKIRKNL